MSARVVVLGGDGFCGWPTALELAASGHSVCIVDNFSRRAIDNELGISPLIELASLSDRIDYWNIGGEGAPIEFEVLDVAADFLGLVRLFSRFQPTCVIHFAEQRAVPYASATVRGAQYTIRNNVLGCFNVLQAICDSGTRPHVIHLGSIGVYGYEDLPWDVGNGYMDARVSSVANERVELPIPVPMRPGSVYHLTKAMDSQVLSYFARVSGLHVTDLHQGVVWGSQTDITGRHPTLVNRYDYDRTYGTVVNRFLLQAALGESLTVYGSGLQQRAIVHLADVVRCIIAEVESIVPDRSELNVKHPFAETLSVLGIANIVSKVSGARVSFVDNPRVETTSHRFCPGNDRFVEQGICFAGLEDQIVSEYEFVVGSSRSNVRRASLG